MIVLAFALLFVGVVICHFHDWKDARNNHINHTRGVKIKGLVSLVSIVLFCRNLHPHGINIISVWIVVKSCWMTGAYFMFLFNAIWGLRVKKDIFYRSTATGKNMAWSEEIMENWPRRVYIAFLLGNPILSTYLYFYA